jgi:hypothetical protein
VSTDREFSIPKVRLHLADGTSAVVEIRNGDRLQWDLTAPRKKWGKSSDVPVLAQTFIAYVAAKREKAIPEGMTWESFQDVLVGLDDVDEEPTVIRPTPTTATGGPS